MKEKLEKPNERNHSQKNSTVEAEEKALILKKTKARRNLDETISSPDRYVSWYQYNLTDIDKHLQLCPHCKKPTFSAFDRTVIDSAIDYLEGKRMYSRYSSGDSDFMPTVTFLVALGIGIYFLVTHVISMIKT